MSRAIRHLQGKAIIDDVGFPLLHPRISTGPVTVPFAWSSSNDRIDTLSSSSHSLLVSGLDWGIEALNDRGYHLYRFLMLIYF